MQKTDKKQSKTPALRFPGFDDKWESSEFDDLVQLRKKKHNPKKENNDYKCIELESLESGTGILLKTFYSQDLKSTKNIFYKGDVLFGKLRSYLKKFYQPNFEGVCSTEIWVLNGKKLTNNFLYFLIQGNRFNKHASVSTGSKMPRSDWEYISSIPFSYPEEGEQRKIASFLGSVDEWVENLKSQKENLETYKLGCMQKIFSQEIRFKPARSEASGEGGDDNGKNFPDWEEKKLGDIVNLSTAPHISASNNGARYLLGMGAVTSEGRLLPKNKTDSSENVLHKNDLIMPNRDIGHGDIIGKVALIDEDNKYVLGSNVYKVSVKSNSFVKFIFYLINSPKINKRMRRLANGTSQLQLVSKDIKKVEILFPSLTEQQKIAGFLTSVDTLIKSKEKQISAAEEWKKGLMQKMFV